jgi:DNA-3-methyladenine glycosylase II
LKLTFQFLDGILPKMTIPVPEYSKAQRHLARRDEVLKNLIRLVGPCTLQHNPNRFAVLVHSIISQQISTKAAKSISNRLEQALAPQGITPRNLARTSEATLRAVGLSGQKTRYLLDLAQKVDGKTLPLKFLHELPDEEVISFLIEVKGIGRWTAQMFLIFSLGRLDVLPIDDFGFRVGVQRQYGLRKTPDGKRLTSLGERWRPYRTIATWYFWRSLGKVPQSE